MALEFLGAVKLTGKVVNGWNFGTLHALTGSETAQFASADTNCGTRSRAIELLPCFSHAKRIQWRTSRNRIHYNNYKSKFQR